MIVRAWRIVKAKHAAAAFTGIGAKIAGGRWNRPGRPAVYVAGSRSLAILEMLVHLNTPDLLKRYVLFEVRFDNAWMISIDPQQLPRTWKWSSARVQALGDAWIAGGTSAVLRVPSAIVPAEWNYLLNPAPPDFARISIGPREAITLDQRLARN